MSVLTAVEDSPRQETVLRGKQIVVSGWRADRSGRFPLEGQRCLAEGKAIEMT